MGIVPRASEYTMSERHAPQCLSCLKLLTQQMKAISLSGHGRPNMCKSCFDALPISKRVQLQLVCRPLSAGGLGLWDLLVRLNRALEAGPQWDRPPGPESPD